MKLKGTPKPLKKPIEEIQEWIDSPYKELLTKYMLLVMSEEGVSFVDNANDLWHSNAPIFTDEEIATLKAIEKEVLKDY